MPYEAPPFQKQIFNDYIIKEMRPLDKPVRCIVLTDEVFKNVHDAKLGEKGFERSMLELAKELGVGFDYFNTSAKPLANLDSDNPADWKKNGDGDLSIVLEGQTYNVDEEKTKKVCEFFEVDPSKIEMRYPEMEWSW